MTEWPTAVAHKEISAMEQQQNYLLTSSATVNKYIAMLQQQYYMFTIGQLMVDSSSIWWAVAYSYMTAAVCGAK